MNAKGTLQSLHVRFLVEKVVVGEIAAPEMQALIFN